MELFPGKEVWDRGVERQVMLLEPESRHRWKAWNPNTCQIISVMEYNLAETTSDPSIADMTDEEAKQKGLTPVVAAVRLYPALSRGDTGLFVGPKLYPSEAQAKEELGKMFVRWLTDYPGVVFGGEEFKKISEG